MVTIPAAEVQIGSSEEHMDGLTSVQHYGREWFEDESPQHRRAVATFAIDTYPVTNGEYLAFTEATGHRTAAELRGWGLVYGASYWEEREGACWRRPAGPGDSVQDRLDHPVVHVGHADALAYAAWAGKRLPTEAEWEYAAHGPQWRCWPWGAEWGPGFANCAEHWSGTAISDFAAWRSWWARRRAEHGETPATTPVGAFSPTGDSPFGVADLAGNVAEWTATTYHLYDRDRSYDPVYTMAAGRYMVVRGGSWKDFRFQVRTSERIAVDPVYSSFALGFRCAADLPLGSSPCAFS
ncbi:formylglycine-generating enzyme family protein [Acrocarpospora corrugata]|nr:SUMF1/EgtB/PvdO family nonheme iron enzyme [Acrocarpospora corrugata]